MLSLHLWIQVGQFDAGVGGRELPLHRHPKVVALLLPSAAGRFQSLLVRDAAVGALTAEHTELALGHVEPTAMHRCVVQLQPVPERLASAGGKASYSEAGRWVLRLSITRITRAASG